MLARCLDAVDGEDIEHAFRTYEAHRKPRTSRIQAISSANTWMRTTEGNPDWLYGYDAWTAPLQESADAAVKYVVLVADVHERVPKVRKASPPVGA